MPLKVRNKYLADKNFSLDFYLEIEAGLELGCTLEVVLDVKIQKVLQVGLVGDNIQADLVEIEVLDIPFDKKDMEMFAFKSSQV